jgi:DNA polymerase-3 subunit gamma/tau
VSAPVAESQAIESGASLPWYDMVIAMNLQSLTRELANNCIFEAVDEHECRLILDPKHAHMSGSRAEEKLQLALQKYYGKVLVILY